MSKWQQFKEAVRNPPPHRLAQIEYRSHFLNILGVVTVSLFLIFKGFWYIVFALIFTIGSSYAQGMTALMKYRLIKNLEGKTLLDLDQDPSPSRRRANVITEIFGSGTSWIMSFLSLCAALVIVQPFGLNGIKEYVFATVLLFVIAIFLYIIAFYFLLYWIAYPMYKKRMKGGLKHGKKT